MAETKLNMQLLLRRDSTFNVNYKLAAGEPGFEIDTNTLKIGDGAHTWGELPIANKAAIDTLISTAVANHAAGYYTKSEVDKFIEDINTAIGKKLDQTTYDAYVEDRKLTDTEINTAIGNVNAKFADYTKTEDLPTDLSDFTNNAGYAKTTDVNVELAKKADKSVVDAMYTNTQIDEFIAAAKKYADDNDANTTYGITYDSENKKIKLVEGGTVSEIDATDFIKDGMIESVALSENGKSIVITWNTDSDKGENNVTSIPLDQLVDVYTGVNGERVVVSVSSDNKISAELVAGSISKNYLDSNVQASLGKADSAIQAHQDISHLATTEALNSVDAKFANYTTTTDLNTELNKKADKTQVATDIATAKQEAIDDAAAKYEEIGVAKDLVDALAAGQVKTNKEAIEAINNPESGILKTAQNYADGLNTAMDERVADLEAKFTGDNSVDAKIAAAVAVETKAREDAVKGVQEAVDTVDAKFASYNTTEVQKGIDDAQYARIKAIEDTYLVEADIADFETKANVKKVADDLAAYVESNDAAVADRYTKTEVDNKFANYSTTEAQKAIDDEQDRRLGVIEGDYLKAADIANFETKENVKKVADNLAAYVESNDAEVLAVRGIAEAARTESEVNDQIDTKIAALDLANTYEAKGAEERAKDYVDGEITEVEGRLDVAESDIDELQEQIKGLSGAMHFKGVYDELPATGGIVPLKVGDDLTSATVYVDTDKLLKFVEDLVASGKEPDERWEGYEGEPATAENRWWFGTYRSGSSSQSLIQVAVSDAGDICVQFQGDRIYETRDGYEVFTELTAYGTVISDPVVDFVGFKSESDETFVSGDVVAVGDKEYVFNGTEFVEFGDISAEGERLAALEGKVSAIEGKPAYGITATQISNWDNEVGAKELAGTKTTTAEVKDQIEAYGYATTGYVDDKAATAKSEAISEANTYAANQDVVVLAEAQGYTDTQISNFNTNTVAPLANRVKDLEDNKAGYATTANVATAKQEAIDAAKEYANGLDHEDTTYTVAATENALEFTVTPTGKGSAQTVKLVAPTVDTGVMSVVEGDDIVVTSGDNGSVTVAHKTFSTGAYTKDPADSDKTGDVYMMTEVTVDNGHVTGANVRSLADALMGMMFVIDGGNSSTNVD